MVKLEIIVEGGADKGNISAETANNVESLRQSLHKFFNKISKRDDIDITIFMGSGYRNAARLFAGSNSTFGLFVDSDFPPETMNQWFDRLTNDTNPGMTIIIPPERIQNVFFMVQEMEAWFLKQPDCLDRWAKAEGYCRKNPESDIADHSVIRGKDIESISKPSEKLEILVKRFFYKGKKAAKYGKLKTAPVLLDMLDVESLLLSDSELRRFASAINKRQQ